MPKNEGARRADWTKVQLFPLHLDVEDGGFLEVKGVQFSDDFLGDVLQDPWNVNADGGGTATIRRMVNGVVELRTAAGNLNKVELAHEFNWKPADGPVGFVAVVATNLIMNMRILAGLASVKNMGATTIGFTSLDVPTPADGFEHAAVFGYDSAAAVNTGLVGLVTNQGVASALQFSGIAPGVGSWATLRIEIGTDGVADFYVDGTLLGSLVGVNINAVLTPYFAVQNRAGGIVRRLGVDRVLCYKTRRSSAHVFSTSTTTSSTTSTSSSSSSTSSTCSTLSTTSSTCSTCSTLSTASTTSSTCSTQSTTSTTSSTYSTLSTTSSTCSTCSTA